MAPPLMLGAVYHFGGLVLDFWPSQARLQDALAVAMAHHGAED